MLWLFLLKGIVSWWSMVKSLPITLKAYLHFQLLSIEGSSLFQTVLVLLVDLALSFPSRPPGLLSLLDPYLPLFGRLVLSYGLFKKYPGKAEYTRRPPSSLLVSSSRCACSPLPLPLSLKLFLPRLCLTNLTKQQKTVVILFGDG